MAPFFTSKFVETMAMYNHNIGGDYEFEELMKRVHLSTKNFILYLLLPMQGRSQKKNFGWAETIG